VCNASARVPAIGPRPAAISSSEAQTSSGIARNAFSSIRVGTRQRAECVRAAGNASSRPHSAASRVPSADMARVSPVALATLRTNAAEVSGGKNSARKRAIAAADSRDHSSRQ